MKPTIIILMAAGILSSRKEPKCKGGEGMKKAVILLCAICLLCCFSAGCGSKNPVGPAGMLSLGSNTTAGTSSTNTNAGSGNTNTSNSGNTTVDTTPINTVSTQTGDTGVSNVEGSTGVNSAITGGSGSGNNGGNSSGTLNMILDSSGISAWGACTVAAGSTPTFSWRVSGVSSISKYEVLVYSTVDYSTYWSITYNSSAGLSVLYGATPSGCVISVAPKALVKGAYNVVVHAKNAANVAIGYANGTLTVN